MARVSPVFAVLLLAGCNKPSQQPPVNAEQPAQRHEDASVTAPPSIPPPATGPDARTPLGPPAKAVDPKSTQAAVELVQHFVDLLNRQKFDQAYLLLGSNAAGSDLRDELRRISNLNIKVLDTPPPQQEGAAGSIYVTVAIWIAGILKGKPADHGGSVVVRRVNDVPGSTKAQRRWHIESILDSRM